MRTKNSDPGMPDNTPFDRLVDGELNESERRELLAGLDQEPEGWRRCALAFLEAQCWKQVLGGLQDASAAESLPAASAESIPVSREQPSFQPQRSSRIGRFNTILAMAASFLVALWLGSLVQRSWRGVSVPVGRGPLGEMAAHSANQKSFSPVGRGAAGIAAAPGDVKPSSPWRVVTVSAPSDGKTPDRALSLPAVERNSLDDQWLQGISPAIPADVLQAFQRTGHQVEQRRELIPVPLKDGRRLLVPVDQVDVHYVGSKEY